MMRTSVLIHLSFLLLEGCAAQDCDPRTAGFMGGVGCSFSGAYAQRTAYQQQALRSASAQALEARAAVIEQGSRAANSRAAAVAAAQQLRQMDDFIADLRARLAAAQRREGIDRTRLEEAQSALARLEQERVTTGHAPSGEQLQELRSRQRSLAALAARL